MKQEDFERLKAVCEKEGFELQDYREGNLVYVKKKDIWEGVEFAEWLDGKICRCEKSTSERFMFLPGFANVAKHDLKPSTESAYVDQLKKEAFERLGEIKAGFTFMDDDSGGFIRTCNKGMDNWHYSKDKDALFALGARIYQSGKWATRVKERIEVFPTRESLVGAIDTAFEKDRDGFSKFLANQLEKYLNGEIHESVSVEELEKIRKKFSKKFIA